MVSARRVARWLLCVDLMDKRIGFIAFGVFAAVSSVAVVVDALVVTDVERLETFVDDLTDARDDARIDAALGHADPSRVPVELIVGADSELYEDGDEVDLAEHTREALSPLAHGKAEVVQKTIDIEGDRAQVAVRVSTDDGMLNAQFRFVRRGDGWLVTRVRVL
jgi:hypothetical protein